MNRRIFFQKFGVIPTQNIMNLLEWELKRQRTACGIMAASAAMHTQSAREVSKACLEAVNVDEILTTHAINETGESYD